MCCTGETTTDMYTGTIACPTRKPYAVGDALWMGFKSKVTSGVKIWQF